jgi:hypothetical protein
MTMHFLSKLLLSYPQKCVKPAIPFQGRHGFAILRDLPGSKYMSKKTYEGESVIFFSERFFSQLSSELNDFLLNRFLFSSKEKILSRGKKNKSLKIEVI